MRQIQIFIVCFFFNLKIILPHGIADLSQGLPRTSLLPTQRKRSLRRSHLSCSLFQLPHRHHTYHFLKSDLPLSHLLLDFGGKFNKIRFTEHRIFGSNDFSFLRLLLISPRPRRAIYLFQDTFMQHQEFCAHNVTSFEDHFSFFMIHDLHAISDFLML